jgi:hypothetical protein
MSEEYFSKIAALKEKLKLEQERLAGPASSANSLPKPSVVRSGSAESSGKPEPGLSRRSPVTPDGRSNNDGAVTPKSRAEHQPYCQVTDGTIYFNEQIAIVICASGRPLAKNMTLIHLEPRILVQPGSQAWQAREALGIPHTIHVRFRSFCSKHLVEASIDQSVLIYASFFVPQICKLCSSGVFVNKSACEHVHAFNCQQSVRRRTITIRRRFVHIRVCACMHVFLSISASIFTFFTFLYYVYTSTHTKYSSYSILLHQYCAKYAHVFSCSLVFVGVYVRRFMCLSGNKS